MINPECTLTMEMIIAALGVIGLFLIMSRYKLAFMTGFLFSSYWAYVMHQDYLHQVFGNQAFLWSSLFTVGLALILWKITALVQEGY